MPELKRIICPSRAISFLVAFALACVFLQTWQMPGARADTTRSDDALGELIAYYQHFLGRAPDATGLDHYLQGAYENCREGVTEAGWEIANSDEAHTFLNTNARLAGSIYSGFLNRVPDEKGWKDQKAALDDSTPWAVVSRNVLSEPEFQARLDTVCRDATANETAICEAAGVGSQGPPSASIPPDLQPFFNCYSRSSGFAFPLSAGCLYSAGKSLTGGFLSAKDLRERLKSGAKLTLKKIGPVGWYLTADGFVDAYKDCR